MKKLIQMTLVVISLGIATLTFSQAVQSNFINYQGVASNASGDVLQNQAITVGIAIRHGAPNVTASYTENHSLTTDANGVFSLLIGNGSTVSGNYDNILWGGIANFVSVSINGTEIGTTELTAVPYALAAGGSIWQNYNGNTISTGITDDNFVFGSDQMDNITSTPDDDKRMFFNKAKGAFRAGWTDDNSWNDSNIGNYSIGLGYRTKASGNFSTAIGVETEASGAYSTAMGIGSKATTTSSTAMGTLTEASGSSSTAMGRYTKASSFVETVIGQYNSDYTPVGVNVWNVADRLFVIGNGASSSIKHNALTVLKNGNVGIGSDNPAATLQIDYNSTIQSPHLSLRENGNDYARINFYTTNRPTNFWSIAGYIGNTVATDRLNFYNSTGGDILSIIGNGDVLVNGSVVHTSDQRLKKDITELDYGLNEVLRLRPVSYYWKNKEPQQNRSLGLIAQEVQPLLRELVYEDTSSQKTLSLDYSGLIPVLIKAIQEQQTVIDHQKNDIEKLSTTLTSTKNDLNELKEQVRSIQKTWTSSSQ